MNEKPKGLMSILRDRFEAGETVRLSDYPDQQPTTVQGYISSLKSARYCGAGRRPLNIERVEKGAYRVVPPQ
jgi:hypothetical protein